MPKHTPTPEQREIIDAAVRTRDNLLVNALAGAAKTSTLEMVCEAVNDIPILSLAFNKRIADELKKRLPPHVECRTMNSLGHGVWSKVVGKRLTVDIQKMATILKNALRTLPKHQQEEAWEGYADTLKWLRIAKRDGYVPPRWRDHASAYNCGTMEQWLSIYPEEPTADQAQLIDAALCASIEAAYAGGVDFDDQIYMPICFGASWPRFPLVCIDEFQDLNGLQHEMLYKLATNRLIGVGDPWQSIYAFRGAKQNGMAAAQERWAMRPLTLSVTFRVPRLGVERAWFRVPHMRWRDGAPDGNVEVLEEWDQHNIPDGAAIICRNNAPLFSIGLRLLSQGRHIKLVGMDIGSGLIRTMKRLGPTSLAEPQLSASIDAWTLEELRKAKREDIVYEKAECLRILCAPLRDQWTLGDAITNATALFAQEGPIQLMSGHKSKGLEFDTVFHLDPWRIPSKYTREGTEEWEQEMNVRYVIETRFKQSLYLIDGDKMVRA
jgi:superfamily I DNA/RNA helicase